MVNCLARAQAITARSASANDAAPPAATPKQAAALRELLAVILPDADDAERAEVRRVALADAAAALMSFRLLAADAMERKRHEAQFGSA